MTNAAASARVSTAIAKTASFLRIDRLRNTGPGERLFSTAYWLYKSRIEARDARALASLIPAGSLVIDVGANLGFFTRTFVGSGARVIALEPERRNAEALRRGAARWGANSVTVLEAAASDISGTVHLAVDPTNHADHQLADAGEPVRSVRLDDLVVELDLGRVSAIKIDVQGAEERVLRGSPTILENDRPLVYVELDEARLRKHLSSAAAVLAVLEQYDYAFSQIVRNHPTTLTASEVLELAEDGAYLDVLCRPIP